VDQRTRDECHRRPLATTLNVRMRTAMTVADGPACSA